MGLGVGLSGFGLAGRYFHAPFLAAAGFDIRAVVTSRAEQAKAVLPEADAVPRFDDLLAREDISLIVVATPNALHFQQARGALEAGKHIVIDKPVTPTSAEARALAGLARARGLIAAAYHNRRWDSDYLTTRKLIAHGRVGAPVRYITSWNRHSAQHADGWREQPGPAAGILFDLGPHLIDQAIQMFGRPDWIEADLYHHLSNSGEGLPDDGFHLHLRKGAISITLESCSLAAGPDRTIRLDGSAASFVKDGGDVQTGQIIRGDAIEGEGFGIEPRERWGRLLKPDRSSEPVESEPGRAIEFYHGMRRALLEGAPPPVSLDEAAEVIELIELAFESARTGRRIPLKST